MSSSTPIGLGNASNLEELLSTLQALQALQTLINQYLKKNAFLSVICIVVAVFRTHLSCMEAHHSETMQLFRLWK